MFTADHEIKNPLGRPTGTQADEGAPVLRYADCNRAGLSALLGRFGLELETVADGEPLDGSFWGGEEAGLIGNRLLLRSDTPVHSVLHEACHYICMDQDRRTGLHTNAGGDYDEENAVCYLQIVLADYLAGMGRERMWNDMDSWGYSFRLGSARSWFEKDAEDACRWLTINGLLQADGKPTWQLHQ
jgi:hypothetical protein